MRTYVIGRDRSADIVIPNGEVGSRHAELIVTNQGEYHLTDCATGRGTWAQTSDPGAEWKRLRQDFVRHDQPLRLGRYDCTVESLLKSTVSRSGDNQRAGGEMGKSGPAKVMPTGTVERDPMTGEILRKRT